LSFHLLPRLVFSVLEITMPGTDLEMPGYLNWLTRLEFWNLVSVVLALVSLCSIRCVMQLRKGQSKLITF